MEIKRVKPFNEEEDKTSQLARMFDNISDKYDSFNDVMSVGMARYWRKKALETLLPYTHDEILDIACGTADIAIKAFEYINPKHITGIDVSPKMLTIGKEKVKKAGLSDKISLKVEDVSKLSFTDETFDVAITSFGIRNFDKLEESIQQIHRVLKPKGKFVILEMSEPQTLGIKQGYKLYTGTLKPIAVKIFSNTPSAYKYLQLSMKAFPQGKNLLSILSDNGFNYISYRTFFFGVCSLYVVEKR